MTSTKEIRVLYLKQRFEPEPAPLRGVSFTDAIRGHGVDMTVLTGFPYYPEHKVHAGYKQRLHQTNTVGATTVHRSASVVGHSARPAHRLLSYLTMPAMSTMNAVRNDLDADLVLTTLGPAPYAHAALALARRLGVPCVFELQDLWPESLTASGMWPERVPLAPLHRSLKFAYKRASAITCLSPGCRDTVIERGANPDTTVAMFNWAPPADVSAADKQVALELVGDWVGRDFITYAGTIGPLQGVDRMIDAAGNIGARLMIIGAGRSAEALRHQVAADQSAVRFVGQQPLGVTQAIVQLTTATTVYLETSELDGSAVPSKVAANLLAGRPMIVAAGGETRKLADLVDAGPRCAPGNTAELAAAFQQALDASHIQRASWTRNAATFAGTWLDADNGLRRYARFLRTVAAGQPLGELVDASGMLQ